MAMFYSKSMCNSLRNCQHVFQSGCTILETQQQYECSSISMSSLKFFVIFLSVTILKVSCSVRSDSLQLHGLYSPWNSPGQNTGVGSRSQLQGILPTQGSNQGLLHCRQIIYQLRHQGSRYEIVPHSVFISLIHQHFSND